MRIRKTSKSIGVVGKILNNISNSIINTYSADFINKLILDRSHPVNSIYISTSTENPAVILGGGNGQDSLKEKPLLELMRMMQILMK